MISEGLKQQASASKGCEVKGCCAGVDTFAGGAEVQAPKIATMAEAIAATLIVDFRFIFYSLKMLRIQLSSKQLGVRVVLKPHSRRVTSIETKNLTFFLAYTNRTTLKKTKK
jgi:hypothetical protein